MRCNKTSNKKNTCMNSLICAVGSCINTRHARWVPYKICSRRPFSMQIAVLKFNNSLITFFNYFVLLVLTHLITFEIGWKPSKEFFELVGLSLTTFKFLEVMSHLYQNYLLKNVLLSWELKFSRNFHSLQY